MRSARHSTARAPWPGAGSIWVGSMTSVASSARPRRRRPGPREDDGVKVPSDTSAAACRRCRGPGRRRAPGRARAAGPPGAASRYRRVDPAGSSPKVRPSRATRQSRGSWRCGTAARTSPVGGRGGQVLERVDGEVDATVEQRVAQRADEDARAAEGGERGVVAVTSVTISTSSTGRPVSAVRACATWPDWATGERAATGADGQDGRCGGRHQRTPSGAARACDRGRPPRGRGRRAGAAPRRRRARPRRRRAPSSARSARAAASRRSGGRSGRPRPGGRVQIGQPGVEPRQLGGHDVGGQLPQRDDGRGHAGGALRGEVGGHLVGDDPAHGVDVGLGRRPARRRAEVSRATTARPSRSATAGSTSRGRARSRKDQGRPPRRACAAVAIGEGDHVPGGAGAGHDEVGRRPARSGSVVEAAPRRRRAARPAGRRGERAVRDGERRRCRRAAASAPASDAIEPAPMTRTPGAVEASEAVAGLLQAEGRPGTARPGRCRSRRARACRPAGPAGTGR